MAFRLSQDELDAFYRDGVAVLRGVLQRPQLQQLGNAIDRIYHNIGTTPTGYDLEALGDAAFTDKDTVSVGMA